MKNTEERSCQDYVMTPIVYNIYAKKQPVTGVTRTFIYADGTFHKLKPLKLLQPSINQTTSNQNLYRIPTPFVTEKHTVN